MAAGRIFDFTLTHLTYTDFYSIN